MSKREMIERAWDALISIMESAADVNVYDYDELFDNLEQAIVIECEAEHTFDPLDGEPWTVVHIASDLIHNLFYEGHHGNPGKALAIIVSLEEEEG